MLILKCPVMSFLFPWELQFSVDQWNLIDDQFWIVCMINIANIVKLLISNQNIIAYVCAFISIAPNWIDDALTKLFTFKTGVPNLKLSSKESWCNGARSMLSWPLLAPLQGSASCLLEGTAVASIWLTYLFQILIGISSDASCVIQMWNSIYNCRLKI